MTNSEHSSAEDGALVAAAREGDLGAFEELVARHRDKIYARAYSMMRSEDDAVDLSQEAWVKGWQRLGQFHGESSFATWMTRIVINLCLDHLRKQKRQRAESLEELDEETGGVERQMPVVTVNPDGRAGAGGIAEAGQAGAGPVVLRASDGAGAA